MKKLLLLVLSILFSFTLSFSVFAESMENEVEEISIDNYFMDEERETENLEEKIDIIEIQMEETTEEETDSEPEPETVTISEVDRIEDEIVSEPETEREMTLEELLNATFEDINEEDVFDVQHERGTCTLVSVTMMMRRAAILSGDPYWFEITQDAVRYESGGWNEDMGMYHNFTFHGITVNVGYLPGGEENESYLIKILAKHPEGIALYKSYDAPHAVLLTDYTDGEFYCSDPAYGNEPGKMHIDDAYSVSIENADYYWYISSPECTFDGVRNGVIDVAGSINGKYVDYFTAAATCDIYIDGKLVETKSPGYIAYYPEGTVYEIKNIKVQNGYEFIGVDPEYKGTLKGTITSEGVNVVLKFRQKILPSFNDINNLSDAFKNAIYWAVEEGVANGVSPNYFGQAESCTRKQFVIMLYRLAGKPEVSGNMRFTDCNFGKGSDSYRSILWAYNNGIIKGYADGTFRPNNTVTRKQVMIMLYRYAGSPDVTGKMTFKDCMKYGKNSDTYKAIIWGCASGITKGTNGGATFSPDDFCLRRQVVLFFYRFNGL